MLKKPQNWLLAVNLMTGIIAIPLTAEAAIINLVATLNQEQEVYPPGFTPTPVPDAFGTANMTYDTDLNSLSWDILFSNLSGPATLAHFHGPATTEETAGVQVDIAAISGLTSPLQGMTTISDEQESQLLSGLWYINIHTEANPPGEIRGQVTVNTVPEPSTLGFLGMASLTFLGYQLRKKRLS